MYTVQCISRNAKLNSNSFCWRAFYNRTHFICCNYFNMHITQIIWFRATIQFMYVRFYTLKLYSECFFLHIPSCNCQIQLLHAIGKHWSFVQFVKTDQCLHFPDKWPFRGCANNDCHQVASCSYTAKKGHSTRLGVQNTGPKLETAACILSPKPTTMACSGMHTATKAKQPYTRLWGPDYYLDLQQKATQA